MGDSKMLQVTEDPKLNVWRAPHVNSFFDTRVVRRSNMLQADLGNAPYGIAFNFMEYALLPANMAASVRAAAGVGGIVPIGLYGTSFDEEVSTLGQQGKLHKEGEGPGVDEMKAWTGFFLNAETTSGVAKK